MSNPTAHGDEPPEAPPTPDATKSSEGDDDRTGRLMPDGTVRPTRPGVPDAGARPPSADQPANPTAARPAQPLVAPAQRLPLSPRRRARDQVEEPPGPTDQLRTAELAAAHPDPVDAGDEPPDGTTDQAADSTADLERTDVVPAVVVPPDVFSDVSDQPATAATGPRNESSVADLPPAVPPPSVDHGGSDDGGDDEGPAAPSRPWWRKPATLVPVGVLAAVGIVYGADLAIAGDDVPRNTVVAGVELGSLSPAAAADTLDEQLAPRVTADHVIVADDVVGTLSPATAGITVDTEGTVQAASGQPLNPWTRLVSLFADREVDPVITGDDTALDAQLEQFAGMVDRAPVDATIAVDGNQAAVVPPVIGRTLDRAGSASAVTQALASGGDPGTPIELPVDTTDVLVDEEQAQQTLEETVTPALSAPVTIVGDDGATTAELGVEGIASALVFTGQPDGTLAVGLDPAALQTALGDQFGEFGLPAQNASFQISGGAIAVAPSVDGTGIDPAVLAEQLLPVLTQPAPRQVSANLGPVPADFTTDAANALGVVEQVSTFTTNFTNQASGTNIRVVAAEVDGALVRPGESFSLNGYTGPRGEAQGYVPAGVINNGEFTQAVGGGISQFATTMFNAVFFAGLEDVFHKPHSYYISRYPAGREATVYYDSIDLKWRNDSPTGIYVQTVWTLNSITVTFWGTKRFDIDSVSSNRYNVRTPVVQEKPDNGSCSPQGGANGFNITVTRIFSDPATGAQIRTEDFQARYAAEPVIRCVPVPRPPTPESSPPPPPAQPTGRRPSRTAHPVPPT